MRHSHRISARPCATGPRGTDSGARKPSTPPRFSREFTTFLLKLAHARLLAGRAPEVAARQLTDWIRNG
jgi:hypothetical protein